MPIKLFLLEQGFKVDDPSFITSDNLDRPSCVPFFTSCNIFDLLAKVITDYEIWVSYFKSFLKQEKLFS